MSKENKNHNQTVLVILLLLIAFFAVFGLTYSLLKLVPREQEYKESSRKQEKVSDIFYGDSERADSGNNSGSADSGASDPKENGRSLQALVDQNSDTIGWVKVDDTRIDYAVMRHPDVDDYYMERDFYGDYDVDGMPFLAKENVIGGERQNYIIYGHRMSDGSMFYDLKKFTDPDFYKDHPSFTLILRVWDRDVTYECQVFSVHETSIDQPYWIPSFMTDEEMEAYIEKAKAASIFDCGVDVTVKDTIVTLSTCDREYDGAQGRMLVHAKLVEKASVPVEKDKK